VVASVTKPVLYEPARMVTSELCLVLRVVVRVVPLLILETATTLNNIDLFVCIALEVPVRDVAEFKLWREETYPHP